jgi:hypothetical protein
MCEKPTTQDNTQLNVGSSTRMGKHGPPYHFPFLTEDQPYELQFGAYRR